jgi:hypothetical protein
VNPAGASVMDRCATSAIAVPMKKKKAIFRYLMVVAPDESCA